MWTIEHNGVTKTPSALGLVGIRRSRASRSVDTVTFTQPVQKADAAPLFARGDVVKVYRDGVQWFCGICQAPRRNLENSESISYTLVGPWWHLKNLVYQQTWRVVEPSTGEETSTTSSHLVLGQKLVEAGGVYTVASQSSSELLADIVAYAASKGAPIQAGAGMPAIYFPRDEVRDITCAEAIERVMRWMPDAVQWIDYSTTPPTLNIKRRSSLAAKTVTIPNVSVLKLDIEGRGDLLIPSVCLKYERTDMVNGLDVAIQGTDIAPSGATGDEFGALVATIDLLGGNSTSVSGVTKTEDILAFSDNANERALFWKYHVPWLNDARITAIDAEVGTSTIQSGGLPRELLDGQIADWMGVDQQEDTITAKVMVTYNNAFSGSQQKIEVMSASIKRTNAVHGTKSYSSLQSFSEAETSPEGLAASIYSALGTLQYSGSVTLKEDECGSYLTDLLGGKLNISGGAAEWATMGMSIQSVTEDLDAGETVVSFGPPDHLSTQDMIELLRVTRNRRVYTAVSARANPSRQSSGSVGLGASLPRNISNTGASDYRLQMVAASATAFSKTDATQVDESSKPIIKKEVTVGTVKHETTIQESKSQEKLTGPSSEVIDINTDDIKSLGSTAKDVKLREVTLYGDVNGESKQFKMVVLSSGKYSPTSIALGGSARWA